MCKSALSILNAIDLTLAAMLAVFIAVSVWGSPVHHNANPVVWLPPLSAAGLLGLTSVFNWSTIWFNRCASLLLVSVVFDVLVGAAFVVAAVLAFIHFHTFLRWLELAECGGHVEEAGTSDSGSSAGADDGCIFPTSKLAAGLQAAHLPTAISCLVVAALQFGRATLCCVVRSQMRAAMLWQLAGGLQSGLAYPGGSGGRHEPQDDESFGNYHTWKAASATESQAVPMEQYEEPNWQAAAGWGLDSGSASKLGGRPGMASTPPAKQSYAKRAVTRMRQEQLNAALMESVPATSKGLAGKAGQAEPPWRR